MKYEIIKSTRISSVTTIYMQMLIVFFFFFLILNLNFFFYERGEEREGEITGRESVK